MMDACLKCLVELHSEHEVCYFGDPLHVAIKNNKQLEIKTNSTISSAKNEMKNVNTAKTKFESDYTQVADEVRTAFSRYKDAIEEREQELLLKIEEIKQNKLGIFLNRLEELSKIISDLNESSETLTHSLYSINDSEIVAANKKAEDILQINFKENKLDPSSFGTIHFNSFDSSLLNSISIAGCVQKSVYVKKCDPNNAISFGRQGNGDGEILNPLGVCCNDLGQIIVSDSNNDRIQVFDSSGTFLYNFGTSGSSIRQFQCPYGIAINPAGNLLVADKNNHRIQIFKMDGTFVFTFGKNGTENGQFNYPNDLACNSLNQIVVADTGNKRIQLFAPDGAFLNQFKYSHNVSLYCVCFTSRGDIIVTDYNSHRLIIVNSMLTKKRFFAERDAFNRQFNYPLGVCCDSDGQIIVVEGTNNRIQVLDSEENYLWQVSLKDQLIRPTYVCLTPEGRMVVTNFRNHELHIL